MKLVHAVVPNHIDDPLMPSGGNRYDRRICQGLAEAGWSVREHAVHGGWPRPGGTERAKLARLLGSLPEDSIVLLDGLIASTVPEVLVPQSKRLRLTILVHMPLEDPLERQAFSVAEAIITTSFWSRRRLLDLYDLPEGRVHAAAPGVDEAALAPGSSSGSNLLCVAAVAPHKGHDLLVQALAANADLPWRCECVGPLTRDPGFAGRIRRHTRASGIAGRVTFTGPRTGSELDARYAAADLLVLASRGETYGMVVTEALARGTPVLATNAKGLPEALGRAPDGSLPGILVPPDDPAALARALRRWLAEPGLRHRLRQSAQGRRATLTGWSITSGLIASVLSDIRLGTEIYSLCVEDSADTP